MTTIEIAARPYAARPVSTPAPLRRASRLALAAVAALAVSGCANFLPQAGPTTGDILDGSPERSIDYAVVTLDANAVAVSRQADPAPFDDPRFRQARPFRTALLGPGDVLNIAIWEPVVDGLLTSTGSKQAVIDQIAVDDRGHVFVPYAGLIRASGRSTGALRQAIVDRLQGKTTDPQVTVTRVEYRSRGVSLQGTIGTPGVQPLEPAVNRLLPMLAVAGGASTSAGATRVTVRRGAVSASGFLDSIYEDPTANIALRSGDIVLVEEKTRSYNAFGSIRTPGRRALSSSKITLLDAIGEIGGLDTQSANPTGVFVFRREPEAVVSQLDVQPLDARKEGAPELLKLAGDTPVVYQLPLNTAEAMFIAGSFKMRDGDTIYVTEAPYSQFRKVLSVIIPALGTAGSVNSLTSVGGS